MKFIFTILTFATLLVSCEKDCKLPPDSPKPVPTKPEMEYTDLNFEITKGKSKQVDINKDGSYDFVFSTLLVGDPLYQHDKIQFFIMGAQYTYFLMGPDETSPIYNKSEIIPISNQGQHTWYDISWEKLAEKIIPETGSFFWNGQWKNVSNKYFGFQLKKNDKLYNGWIKMSFNTQEEKLIVHGLAISKIAGRDVIAGE